MGAMARARLALLAAGAFGAAALPAQDTATATRSDQRLPEASCTPPAAEPAPTAEAAPVLVEGLGYAGIEADSDDRRARAFFAQGVRLIWAFDEAEAVRAFREAQRIDPGCALCFLGEAWARGPTINLRQRGAELPAAREALARAEALADKLGPRDRLILEGMKRRVGAEGWDSQSYAAFMETAALRMPGDDLIAVLAADARMVALGASGFKPGSLSQRLLERVIARNPDHGGAIHYYIHLTDWIDRQHLAEPHADRLGRIAPGASHLVHMPSHTYYGIGRYADAAAVNVKAIAADRAYEAKASPPPSGYRTGLLGHNKHFAINSALIHGDGATALAVSDQFRSAFMTDAEPSPFIYIIGSATFYASGLHGAPAEVLAMPEPEAGGPLPKILRHYARGEALARGGDAAAVDAEAKAILAILDANPASGPNSMPATLAAIMAHVLEGRAAMIEGNHEAAAAAYRKGMERQLASGFGSDPPLFWYSVRRSLGAAMLAAGDHEGARLQLLASLRRWPNDPLALYALARAEAGLGWTGAAARSLARARAGWAGRLEDVPLARI